MTATLLLDNCSETFIDIIEFDILTVFILPRYTVISHVLPD